MRIVFMGTPAFAATILEELVQHHEVVAVYTRPDAVRGRGKALLASPVKDVALREGIDVHTPKTLRDEAEQSILAAYQADIICVAAYGMILPKAVLDIPRFGCLNVHASLLPRWRGAAPIERAILAGDEQAGVCIMRMEEGLDTGAYCVCRATDIADKPSDYLTDELANLGARALLTALVHVSEGKAEWVEQDEAFVTHAAKIEKGELYLDPAQTAVVNALKVQASSLAHPSRCLLADKTVTVLSARVPDVDAQLATRLNALSAGEALFAGKRLFIACADGVLELLALKPDGKKEMDAKAFAAGVQSLRSGELWNAVSLHV